MGLKNLHHLGTKIGLFPDACFSVVDNLPDTGDFRPQKFTTIGDDVMVKRLGFVQCPFNCVREN
jgi:hypothetical protein